MALVWVLAVELGLSEGDAPSLSSPVILSSKPKFLRVGRARLGRLSGSTSPSPLSSPPANFRRCVPA